MTIRLPFLSFYLPLRSLFVRLMLTLLVSTLALLTLRIGTYQLTSAELFAAIFDSSDVVKHMVVFEHRLPRILVAIGAGAAFGLAGMLFQTMLKNPLASPDWIGFTPGASLGALLAIFFTGGNILFGALIGIGIAASIVLVLAMDNGLNVRKLIIIGIGVNLTIAACADLLLARLDTLSAADMARWLIGSLNARDWSDVQLIWLSLIALLPLIFYVQFPLKRLSLADDVASGLGINISGARLIIAIVGTLLVAVAVCVAGPLPFVAFVAGPLAKRLEGREIPSAFSAALIGGTLVLVADFLSRLTPLVQLPAGVFTAIIGAPILLWLLAIQIRNGKL